MTCYEKWSLLLNFLIAIGTIGAVWVAIFGNWIRQQIFRARLDISILNKEGELTKSNNNKRAIIYHLKVTNLRKSLNAKNCRIFLKKIQKRQADGEYHDFPSTVIYRYPWAPSSIFPDAIDVVTEHILDFGIIEESAELFRPIVNPSLDSFKGNLKANESYRYFLGVIADNYRPKKLFIIEVSWDGKWTSNLNEMKNSLVIKKLNNI